MDGTLWWNSCAFFLSLSFPQEKWFYHLSSTQGGDQLELTATEKVLSQIMHDQSVNPRDNSNWKHPVLNWTSGRLHQPLTSLPSSSLNAEAKNLFQHLQLYLSTPMKPMAFEHHLCSVQHLIDSCLKHPPLQDELYCQLLRQISGHASMTAHQVLQGWFLLYLMIHMFLPLKVKFNWYLQMFLDRHIASSNITISNFALECSGAVKRAQQDGRRQCKPSYYELSHLLSRFAGTPTTLDATLTLHVNLPDSTQRVSMRLKYACELCGKGMLRRGDFYVMWWCTEFGMWDDCFYEYS